MNEHEDYEAEKDKYRVSRKKSVFPPIGDIAKEIRKNNRIRKNTYKSSWYSHGIFVGHPVRFLVACLLVLTWAVVVILNFVYPDNPIFPAGSIQIILLMFPILIAAFVLLFPYIVTLGGFGLALVLLTDMAVGRTHVWSNGEIAIAVCVGIAAVIWVLRWIFGDRY